MKSAIKRIKGILLALMYVVINMVIAFAVYTIYNLWHIVSGRLSATEIEKSANDNSFALSIMISIVSLWTYLLVCKLRGKDISEYVKNKKAPPMNFSMAISLACGCRLLVAVYYQLVQKIDIFEKSISNASQFNPEISTATGYLVALFGTLIVAPLFEEFLFRGLVMGELMKIMRPWAAITLQALAFGLVHGVLFQGVFAFFMGIVLGILYYRTKNISMVALCHGAFNLTVALMKDLSVAGIIIYVVTGLFLTAFSLKIIFENSAVERKN